MKKKKKSKTNIKKVTIHDDQSIIVPISQIKVAKNPREKLENIENLAASIKASGGLLQPLVVAKIRDGWELVAGARRLAALRLLGAKDAPVRVFTSGTENLDTIRLVENLQRDDLSGWETCKAIHALLPQFQSQRRLAEAIGKTESYVSKALAVVNSKPELERVQGRSLRELFGTLKSSGNKREGSGAVAGGRYVEGAIQLKSNGPRFSLRLNFDPERTPAHTKAKILETLRALLAKLEAK